MRKCTKEEGWGGARQVWARGALPQAAVAGEGGGAVQTSPSDPEGWPEGVACAVSLGEYVCS